MSAAQLHIRAVAKNNPNHDEHGRFASGEGGEHDDDASHWSDEEEQAYQDEHAKLSDKEHAIVDTSKAIAKSVKALEGLHDKLGKHSEGLSEFHSDAENVSPEDLAGLKVSKAGEDTRSQIVDEAKSLSITVAIDPA